MGDMAPRMRRSPSSRGLLFLAVAALVLALGCSGKVDQAGGLEIIVYTDMPTPARFATASRLASGPPALNTAFADSSTRSRLRTASERGLRSVPVD